MISHLTAIRLVLNQSEKYKHKSNSYKLNKIQNEFIRVAGGGLRGPSIVPHDAGSAGHPTLADRTRPYMTKLRVSHAGKGVPVSGQIQRNKVHHFPQFLSFKEPEFVRVFLTRLEITTSVIPRLAGLSITGAHLRPPL